MVGLLSEEYPVLTFKGQGCSARFARLKTHHERSLFRLAPRRGARKMPLGSRKGHWRPCEVAIPEQIPGGELPNSSGWASLAPAPRHTLWLQPLHPRLPSWTFSCMSCTKTSSPWTRDKYVVHIKIYIKLHVTKDPWYHEQLNMYVWTKCSSSSYICKMNIEKMYMKLTLKHMTYIYIYSVLGTRHRHHHRHHHHAVHQHHTPLKCKSSTADLMIHSSTNHWTTMTMPLLTTISNVLLWRHITHFELQRKNQVGC